LEEPISLDLEENKTEFKIWKLPIACFWKWVQIHASENFFFQESQISY